jgi:hypothetical protein
MLSNHSHQVTLLDRHSKDEVNSVHSRSTAKATKRLEDILRSLVQLAGNPLISTDIVIFNPATGRVSAPHPLDFPDIQTVPTEQVCRVAASDVLSRRV